MADEYYKIKKATLDSIAEEIGKKKGATIPIDETSAGDNLAEEIKLLDMTDAFANSAQNTSFSYTDTYNKITSVRSYGFYNNTGLVSISLPVCTSAATCAFSGCTNCKTIEMDSLVSISAYAFQNCSSLTSAYFPLCKSVSGSSIFSGCTKLESVNLKSCTGAINNDNSNGMFYNCTSLKKVVFGQLSSFGGNSNTVMQNCSALRLADFRTCTSVVTARSYPFHTTTTNMCYIVVPDSLVDDWRAATNWSKYHTGGTYGSYYTIVTEDEYNTAREADPALPELDTIE